MPMEGITGSRRLLIESSFVCRGVKISKEFLDLVNNRVGHFFFKKSDVYLISREKSPLERYESIADQL